MLALDAGCAKKSEQAAPEGAAVQVQGTRDALGSPLARAHQVEIEPAAGEVLARATAVQSACGRQVHAACSLLGLETEDGDRPRAVLALRAVPEAIAAALSRPPFTARVTPTLLAPAVARSRLVPGRHARRDVVAGWLAGRAAAAWFGHAGFVRWNAIVHRRVRRDFLVVPRAQRAAVCASTSAPTSPASVPSPGATNSGGAPGLSAIRTG